jgi:hypothetical protein
MAHGTGYTVHGITIIHRDSAFVLSQPFDFFSVHLAPCALDPYFIMPFFTVLAFEF